MRLNERYSIAGAAGILGLFVVVGLFGFFSLLGADPREPLASLGSEEEVISPEGFDGPFQMGTSALSESAPPAEPPPESQAEVASTEQTEAPTATPATAVLAASAAREARPAATQAQAQSTAGPAPPAVAPPPPTPPPTPEPTPVPTAPPDTPTPQPDVCSTGGTPGIRENGKHVRIENGSVVAFQEGVALLDVGGVVVFLRITPSTVLTGNLGAATLVRAEGHREGDGSVTGEVVEVLCPDSARG